MHIKITHHKWVYESPQIADAGPTLGNEHGPQTLLFLEEFTELINEHFAISNYNPTAYRELFCVPSLSLFLVKRLVIYFKKKHIYVSIY